MGYRMELNIRYDCSDVNWEDVSETLRRVGMSYGEPEMHRRAFEASHTTVFAYHEGQLIGFGRAISDGVYQAAIYDVAVMPEFQRKGIGATIVKSILDRLPQCNFILYASPGKEAFYRTLGLRKMKTGMALFKNAESKAERGFTD
jgi:GNAT superfamily N-acetyltransferase